MSKVTVISVACACIALAGCAMTSDVMDMGGGVYMISAHAAPARGGAAGANQVAYKDANAFCGRQGGHAVVIDAADRDVMQGAISGNNGAFAGSVFEAGNTNMRFRCDR